MIRGTIVNIAGTDYTVPPFNMGLWERFDGQVKAYDAGDDKGMPQMVRAFVPLIVENVQRNHPDFRLDAGEWDLPTFLEARAACLATSRPGKPSESASGPIDWRNLICRTASALGITPGAVRSDMTLDDVLDLHDYWKDHPPVQWMVQAYLGIDSQKDKELSGDDLKRFATTGVLPV